MMRYAGKMEALRRKWGGRCVMCGRGYVRLEFAHLPGKPTRVRGRGRGTPQRYHDVLRNPGSYVLLCRRCHGALDGARWHSAEEIMAAYEQQQREESMRRW